LAWRRLLELKGYIRTLEANLAEETDQDSKKDSQRLTKIMLTNDEWDLLRDLIPILGLFEETTRYLGGSNYSTHNITKPLIAEIINKLKPEESTPDINIENLEDVFVLDDMANVNSNEKECQRSINLDEPLQTSGILKKVKNTLYQAMLFYWKGDREISYLPSILDPRIKKLDFAPDEREQTLLSLQDKYSDMKFSMSLHSSSQSSTPQSPAPSSPAPLAPITPFAPSPTLYQSTLFDIFKHTSSPVNAQNEIDEYLALAQIPFNTDPFSWWRINKERFPVLSELARAYLSVSATSTPSERLFSDCGNLMGAKRARISPEFF